jgi:hypothetical protein
MVAQDWILAPGFSIACSGFAGKRYQIPGEPIRLGLGYRLACLGITRTFDQLGSLFFFSRLFPTVPLKILTML